MISVYILNFNNEFFLFNENFNLKQNIFVFSDFYSLFFLNDYVALNFVFITETVHSRANTIVNFINQTEDASFFNNLENVKTVYHYSVPNTKLAYPEPFIASASMMHSDL